MAQRYDYHGTSQRFTTEWAHLLCRQEGSFFNIFIRISTKWVRLLYESLDIDSAGSRKRCDVQARKWEFAKNKPSKFKRKWFCKTKPSPSFSFMVQSVHAISHWKLPTPSCDLFVFFWVDGLALFSMFLCLLPLR